ncbi:hypothetical protein Ade02nite_86150 [Paractinoplanes deccanensis]|uniref:Translation initiation factor 2 n=1 Tax=Paractinoplanes deccanensis TaxID=113561 RepID=A0ABQ3YIZ5_9ACTN|nr:hypothetical protein [Actinoplanes deccanensis]GID79974.1 hypothetical protein Ade02nite_86150 [Actinoplanes deccanensis]
MLWNGQCAVAEYAFDEPASMPRWTLPEETEVVVTEERVVYRDPATLSTGELRWPWPQHLRVQPGNRDSGRSATVTQIQLVCAGPDGSFPALVFAGGDLAAVGDADRLANTLRQAIARYRVEHATELGIPVLQARMLSRLVIGPEFTNFQGGEGQTVTLIGAVSVQRFSAEPQNPWGAAGYAPADASPQPGSAYTQPAGADAYTRPADAYAQPADAYAQPAAADAYAAQPAAADAYVQPAAADAYAVQPAAADAYAAQAAAADAYAAQPADAYAQPTAEHAYAQPADAYAQPTAVDAHAQPTAADAYAQPPAHAAPEPAAYDNSRPGYAAGPYAASAPPIVSGAVPGSSAAAGSAPVVRSAAPAAATPFIVPAPAPTPPPVPGVSSASVHGGSSAFVPGVTSAPPSMSGVASAPSAVPGAASAPPSPSGPTSAGPAPTSPPAGRPAGESWRAQPADEVALHGRPDLDSRAASLAARVADLVSSGAEVDATRPTGETNLSAFLERPVPRSPEPPPYGAPSPTSGAGRGNPTPSPTSGAGWDTSERAESVRRTAARFAGNAARGRGSIPRQDTGEVPSPGNHRQA